MSKLSERMIQLKKTCLACWATAFGDFFPQSINTAIAAKELTKYGNPSCVCKTKRK